MKRTGSKSKLVGDESFCSDWEVCTISQHVLARETKGGAVDTEHTREDCAGVRPAKWHLPHWHHNQSVAIYRTLESLRVQRFAVCKDFASITGGDIADLLH